MRPTKLMLHLAPLYNGSTNNQALLNTFNNITMSTEDQPKKLLEVELQGGDQILILSSIPFCTAEDSK